MRLVSACTLDGYIQTNKNDVYFLPKQLDEKMAKLHIPH